MRCTLDHGKGAGQKGVSTSSTSNENHGLDVPGAFRT